MRFPTRFPAHMVLVGALAVALAGCAAPGGPNETGGMVVGGVLGGALGSQVGGGSGRTAATIVGALIGANIGANVGRSMDSTDRMRTAQVFETAPTGQATRWVNPDTRNQYSVTPTRTYERGGAPCREYTMQVMVGGRPDTVYGTACRQPDGSWQVMN
ncbi:glycine zipper 2TM domain-containing protein [Hydrogenophaga sp.]|uniref:glycine zipper 2TM domain-containing protein n=1 Tax=Hydrogenophaga sp. TaxID=1904254 RepID=UPI0027204CB2|nr:glycine zipper 2TM domain-containing protein [Hydrogenophaga sp.]MDO9251472.1 glycine zipper 2TM domain-containing protein [Hydrogenophaga sp.]MDP2408631.1 glycine zipper 2TM domain-containing protein [Hydrogenophaga sp.]MDP3324499.1 glycine zipper 2TM domain-containing protein [Hydrogenophaga sp.]MDP3884109.1 glycine zipper 2TM domain-containing protein [Hydrogenophaga sp.]MDZ4173737.1 glycine zipper 2TM domain-containing protein [Hydrogenophaga sp.]